MYDQRKKALRDQQWLMEGAREEGRDEGREEGREEGLEKGCVIGTIATLQGIIGEHAMRVDELKQLDEAELNRLCADLQERLRSRGG